MLSLAGLDMVIVATVFPGARSCSRLKTPGWPLLAEGVAYCRAHGLEICACLVQKFGLPLTSTRDSNDRPVEDELSICLAPTAPAVRSALRIVDDDVLGLAEHDMWTTCSLGTLNAFSGKPGKDMGCSQSKVLRQRSDP